MIGETGERKSAVATPDGKSRKKKKKKKRDIGKERDRGREREGDRARKEKGYTCCTIQAACTRPKTKETTNLFFFKQVYAVLGV